MTSTDFKKILQKLTEIEESWTIDECKLFISNKWDKIHLEGYMTDIDNFEDVCASLLILTKIKRAYPTFKDDELNSLMKNWAKEAKQNVEHTIT